MVAYNLYRQQVWLPQDIRLSSQKISEVLSKVTRESVADYFALHHQRQGEVWKDVIAVNPQFKGQQIEYVLDSTSISTYSNNNPLAQWGNPKQNPKLNQINLTYVCDQRSGDILFAHYYDGSVNDIAFLRDVLMAMKGAGFDFDKNILVTDCGCSSMMNMQQMLNMEIAFVQGVRCTEKVLHQRFDKYKESLRNGAF